MLLIQLTIKDNLIHDWRERKKKKIDLIFGSAEGWETKK
jgi:hypothetical protein